MFLFFEGEMLKPDDGEILGKLRGETRGCLIKEFCTWISSYKQRYFLETRLRNILDFILFETIYHTFEIFSLIMD